MRDLEQSAAMAPIQTFCKRPRAVRQGLEGSRKIDYRHEKQRWHLGAAEIHTQAVDWPAIKAAFERLRRGEVKDYRIKLSETDSVIHIQAQIVERVARLHPDTLRATIAFCDRRPDLLDLGIARFDREIQFFLAYLGHIVPLRARPAVLLSGSLPLVVGDRGRRCFRSGAGRSAPWRRECRGVQRCGAARPGPERTIMVSGSNQGGKTTFARMIGQMHWQPQIRYLLLEERRYPEADLARFPNVVAALVLPEECPGAGEHPAGYRLLGRVAGRGGECEPAQCLRRPAQARAALGARARLRDTQFQRATGASPYAGRTRQDLDSGVEGGRLAGRQAGGRNEIAAPATHSPLWPPAVMG
jgi:hypothetical protein